MSGPVVFTSLGAADARPTAASAARGEGCAKVNRDNPRGLSTIAIQPSSLSNTETSSCVSRAPAIMKLGPVEKTNTRLWADRQIWAHALAGHGARL
jgi:hypothetical protein